MSVSHGYSTIGGIEYDGGYVEKTKKEKVLLGNVAEIQNFLRITKINLWSNLATRGRRMHPHTLVDR